MCVCVNSFPGLQHYGILTTLADVVVAAVAPVCDGDLVKLAAFPRLSRTNVNGAFSRIW